MKKSPEQVNVHEAKTHLSKLLGKVSRGRTIIIKKGNRPVAQLSPIVTPFEARVFGRESGRIVIADDFDSLPEKFLNHFKK